VIFFAIAVAMMLVLAILAAIGLFVCVVLSIGDDNQHRQD
jgi:hypothetical protein